MTDETAYLTKADAANYSSISKRKLDTAKAAGELPFFRVGSRKVLFARRDLDRWLASMRVQVTPGGGR